MSDMHVLYFIIYLLFLLTIYFLFTIYLLFLYILCVCVCVCVILLESLIKLSFFPPFLNWNKLVLLNSHNSHEIK